MDKIYKNSKTRTVVADVSNLTDPKFVGSYYGASDVIDHNLYIKDDFAYQASYRSGLRVLDVLDVDCSGLFKKVYFDVYPEDNDSDFNGAWSNYPFFDSGIVMVSGIEQGLYVLRVDTKFPDDDDEEEICGRRNQWVDERTGECNVEIDKDDEGSVTSGGGSKGDDCGVVKKFLWNLFKIHKSCTLLTSVVQ